MRSIRIVKHVWVFFVIFYSNHELPCSRDRISEQMRDFAHNFLLTNETSANNPSLPPLASIRITSIDPAKRIQDVQSKSINQLISKYFNFKIDCLMTNNTLESENKTFAPARRVRSAIVVAANPLCIISFLPQGTNITLTTIAIHPLSLSLSLPRKISHRNH